MLKRKAYTLAFLLGGALLLVLCALILTATRNTDGEDASNYTFYTPPANEATESPGQRWGDFVGGQPTDSITPSPAPTPVATFVPATPEPTKASTALRNGDEGADVTYAQQRLKELGYLSGSADGKFGNATERAVRDFQTANGLSADGVVGTQTMNRLKSSSAKAKAATSSGNTSKATDVPRPRTYTASTPNANYGYLAPGDKGSKVTSLQKRLIELGYLSGSANGTYDTDTEEAVRAFQTRNGQWVDGKAGPDTQSVLYSSRALAARSND